MSSAAQNQNFVFPLELKVLLYIKYIQAIPPHILLLWLFALVAILFVGFYLTVVCLSTSPRFPFEDEKSYITSTSTGEISDAKPLPSWFSKWDKVHKGKLTAHEKIEDADIFMSVVIPAYNEEERLGEMLDEAIPYLDATYGRASDSPNDISSVNGTATGHVTSEATEARNRVNQPSNSQASAGYEIILVNDGSKDKTVDLALRIAAKYKLHDILRVITLKQNRGKGGAVTHGFRHVRGQYAVFVDADGASRITDLGKLVEGCKEIEDDCGRGIAVGSRAHMVGSDAVIKRSALRNFLMRSFHLLLRLLTPPATSAIKDTQCGFKLFSRASLPHIIPYMHAEGWIFDVEMLMLAESAPGCNDGKGIRVAEVVIGWKEVGGSKLNVMWDSLGMAYGLALLRCAWMVGVYRRR